MFREEDIWRSINWRRTAEQPLFIIAAASGQLKFRVYLNVIGWGVQAVRLPSQGREPENFSHKIKMLTKNKAMSLHKVFIQGPF